MDEAQRHHCTKNSARALPLRLAILAAGLCAVAFMSPARAQSSVIDIPAPRQADWSQTVLRDDGAANVFAGTLNAAFNETGQWQVGFSLPASTGPGSTSNSLALIYDLQGWNPATQGGIDWIDISMDIRGLSSTFAGGVTGFIRPVVEQAGQIYSVLGSSVSISLGTTGPTTWSLNATDNWLTSTGASGLDLSDGGAPLLFGFRYDLGTSCSGATGCKGAGSLTTVSGLRYEIHAVVSAVPEPTTWALMLAGIGLLGMRRPRGRSRTAPAESGMESLA